MQLHFAMPDRQSAEAREQPGWERWFRRKGHLSSRALLILTVLACVPLLSALARIAAFPGIHVPGLSALGGVLNSWFAFAWVPHADRSAILYILLLPAAALLITLARLTFGLRVLGFRAILIAIGFQEIGILPSLLLIALVVATILVARPSMRSIQLPFYARIAVILCIAAMIMVGSLLLGPWLGSTTLWSFAFFPVVILAMLAEGIASTLARDDAWTAAWRAGWTIALALLIAFISSMPAVRELVLLLPELIVTQLVAIVLVSEFLDFRWLEQWPARGRRWLRESSQRQPPSQPVKHGQPVKHAQPVKVAVVQNRWNKNVIGHLGMSALTQERTQSVQVVVDALREQGFTVRAFEGDMSLLHGLHEYLPADRLTAAPGGLVLNLAAGVQGRGRSCHVPAMLEMAGVAYTGPDPIVQACLLDRYALMMLLRQAGVSTPRVKLMSSGRDDPGDLRFPLIVRPRYELAAYRTVVKDRHALGAAVEHIVQTYAQEALIETPEMFPEIRVSLLGNQTIECLPLLQADASGKRACPAPIDEALAERLRACARTAYAAVGCRDYARIDIRLTARGKLHVVGVHALGIFARNGSFAQSAATAGYSFGDLMRRVVDVAWSRYGAAPALPVPAEREPHRLESRCISLTACACMAMLAADAFGARHEDRYPAVWLDASSLFEPRFGEVRFVARDGVPLSAFVYRATAFDPDDGPIWFVMHGAGRGAGTYLRAAAPIAERHDALAIAIEFSERTHPAMEAYTLGVTTRGAPDAKAHAERRWRARDSYVYSEVEHVFEAVRRSFDGRQKGYYLFGHSAGAQFVHRLLTFLPDARVLGAVAANAGWYTLPVNDDDPHFAMPYGLRGTPLSGVELRSLFRTPLTVMVGARDTAQADEDRLLRGTPAAMAQGATRLERGKNYFATARAAASRIAAPFHWRFAIVPRAAHEATEMIGSAAFFLFESGEPCVSTPAAAAGALVINEILADPPGGARGDANSDGMRDPADDEFIEIVNSGHAPVCTAGWTIGDASKPQRHVFPLGAALLPGEALVIFGGGVPTGEFGGARVQWAAFGGRLNLSNAGDVLTLRDAAATVVKQISWGDCADRPCARDHRAGGLGFANSLVRSPEIVGRWTVHDQVSQSNFSPGVRADGTSFSSREDRVRKDVAAGGESRDH